MKNKHTNCIPATHTRADAGFALVEVLIASLVLSIGLLGMAGLQVAGLRANQTSYLRSIVSQQAYDMADRIRANPTGVTAGSYDSISGTGSNPGCITAGCTPAQMAQYDKFRWNTDNAGLLPSGKGTVTRAGSVFTITVMWDDARTGATGTSCSGNPAVDLACFRVSMQP